MNNSTSAAKHTPGPWGMVVFPRERANDPRPPLYLVTRERGDGFRESLRNDGFASVHNHGRQYLYTAEEARAAIEKVTGGAA